MWEYVLSDDNGAIYVAPFGTFLDAQEHLLNALWWMSEDSRDDSVLTAWQLVSSWTAQTPGRKVVTCGIPPGKFELRRHQGPDSVCFTDYGEDT